MLILFFQGSAHQAQTHESEEDLWKILLQSWCTEFLSGRECRGNKNRFDAKHKCAYECM